MADRIRLGPGYWVICLAGGLILTFALVFLGIVDWETIWPVFLIGWGGGNIAIIAAGRAGMTRDVGGSSMALVAGLFIVLAMVFEGWILQLFLSVNPASISVSDSLLVNVLFAIYEETLFLGIRVSCKAGNLPDIVVLIIEGGCFLPWHVFRYPVDVLFFVILLIAFRLTMSAVSLITDHSDPPVYGHTGYNILASLRWI